MILAKIRSSARFIAFILLTYGAYLGLKLGHFFPCFSCPFVNGCPGDCYLMALQKSQWGLEMQFSQIFTAWGLRALSMFFGFASLVILLSKTWCGWICPFGSLQDAASLLRKKLGLRESKFSWDIRKKLKVIKYLLLAMLILVPLMIANTGLHPDFSMIFCQICPAKPLMPVFEGNFEYLALDLTNPITIVLSGLSLFIAGVFLAAMFFKERVFCIFCPMLALISLFEKIGLPQLKKNTGGCTGCGNCQRACPMDIREVHLEEKKENVVTQDCLLCLRCVEACPEKNVLSLKALGQKVVESSPERAGHCSIGEK